MRIYRLVSKTDDEWTPVYTAQRPFTQLEHAQSVKEQYEHLEKYNRIGRVFAIESAEVGEWVRE